jgi:fluoride exporter
VIAWLWVAFGGALGSMARYGVGIGASRAWGDTFPWGTLLINIAGSFVIGFFGTLTSQAGPMSAAPGLRIFVMVGVCGGFTTFSSFSLQTLELVQAGEPIRAGLYVALSVVLCLVGVFLGYWLASRICFLPRTEP